MPFRRTQRIARAYFHYELSKFDIIIGGAPLTRMVGRLPVGHVLILCQVNFSLLRVFICNAKGTRIELHEVAHSQCELLKRVGEARHLGHSSSSLGECHSAATLKEIGKPRHEPSKVLLGLRVAPDIRPRDACGSFDVLAP